MADVRFEVRQDVPSPPKRLWDELVDWKGHEAWVPATRVEVEPGDPNAVGARFTATTGIGPLGLKDRMEVTRFEWDDERQVGACEVKKLGPILRGRAWFTVEPGPSGSVVLWNEDVTVPYTPRFLAPVMRWIGATGFRRGLRRLTGLLESRGP